MKIASTVILALFGAPSALASRCGGAGSVVMMGEVRNSADKSQCIDGNGSGEGDVGTAYCDGEKEHKDQDFEFCSDGTIRSTKTGLCISKEGFKFAKMLECSGLETQSWKIAETSFRDTDNDILQTFFFLRVRDETNHCLDVAGSSGSGDMVTYRCQFYLSDQRWYVRGRGKAVAHGKLLNKKSNHCLDVQGRYGYGNIAPYRCQDLEDQVFTLYENGEMVNAASEQCLSVDNVDGEGNIEIGSCVSAKFQQWTKETTDEAGEYFYLMNKQSKWCLDVEGDLGRGDIKTTPCDQMQAQWKWIAQEVEVEVTRVGNFKGTKNLKLRSKKP